MLNSKVSLRVLLYMVAAAALSAFVFLHAPVTFAQTPSGSDAVVSNTDSSTDPVLSGSDALSADLADSSLAVIELDEYAVYTIDETLTVNRNVTIVGNGATLDFAKDASLSVPEGVQLTISSVSLNSAQGHSMTVSGSVVFGDGVSFGGDIGIQLKKNGMLTSSGKAVTALNGLKALVHADPAGAALSLKDIRLAQTSGETNLLTAANTSGYIVLSGSVDILASDGMAVYCPSSADGPVFSVESGAQLSIAAQNAVLNQELDIPGAAMDIRSCDFTTGSGAVLGITGSYCGIAAKNITLGSDTTVTALCAKKSENGSSLCAALSASEKLSCQSGATITVGSSGGNFGSGLSASKGIDLSAGVSVVFRSNSTYGCALYSEGTINAGAECSVLSKGGLGGIYGKGITFGEQLTLDVEDISGCGLHSSGAIQMGAKATIDIRASRSAVYATGGISFSPDSLVTLESEGNDAAVWLDGTSADSLALNGCTLSVTCTTNTKAKKNAAVFVSGAVTAEIGADITIINGSDFGLICAGGSVNVKGEKTVLRVSGGAGILLSQGSLLISDSAKVLAEGTADSAIRIEKGSFSATGKAFVDAQGKRFGIETLSGDVYIDGAAFFDIRSTADRAVFVENGRLTIINVERLSAWLRADDGKNSTGWWESERKHEHSWDLTSAGADDNWLYADHTALSPNLTNEHRQGTATSSEFKWFNGEWSPADYSRLGQYISRPAGRANAFNIPAGKSFSWMLFGSSYDNTLEFRLLKSTGDGTFDLREDGTFTYSSLDYSRGMQSFDFVVENGDGALSTPATVNIFVTASKPPVAFSATFPVTADEKYIGQVSIIDYDGTIASININEQPRHGTLIMNSDGRFSYEPDFGYIGSDFFTYTAIDNMGDESSTGYITLAVSMMDNVIPCNATIVTESSVPASTRLTAILGNDSVQPAPQFQIVTPPVYGELVFDENEPDLVTYIPYEDFSGTDLFTYSVLLEDGTLTQPAYVTIATVPSQRPIATGGTFYCTKNSSCSGKLSGYDIDGTIGLYSISEQPEHGTVSLNTVTGEFTYQAQSGFTGETWFAFTVTDSDGLISEPVRVTIRVSSLIDNLRSTGRLGAAAIILCVILAAVGGVVALIIISSARRRRELDDEKAKSRLFDYSGSGSNDYDFYDDYRS